METKKKISMRVTNKHDYEVNWLKATNFIPENGEPIIYDAEVDKDGNIIVDACVNKNINNGFPGRNWPYRIPRIKIGDGLRTPTELPFSNIILPGEGENSTVSGKNNYAEGNFAHAEGDFTYASGNYSHSEGNSTWANGESSHTEGERTTADAIHSHAEGYETFANGEASHAEGAFNWARGYTSHAEGEYTEALTSGTHAEGYNTIAGCKGFYISAIDLENHKIYLSKTKVTPTLGESEMDLTFETPGYDLADPSYASDQIKNAYCRFSIINGSHFDMIAKMIEIDHNVVTYEGELGFTEIKEDRAGDGHTFRVPAQPTIGVVEISPYSSAHGIDNRVSGRGSAAFGFGNIVSGDYSFAEGIDNVVGYTSHAEGRENSILGQYGHAEGRFNKIEQGVLYAHVEGLYAEANGEASHAEGSGKTYAKFAHAEGNNAQAYGESSHAEGCGATAEGATYAHAEGKSIAGNKYAHAEGNDTCAVGESSHAEGAQSRAEGLFSHAEGQTSKAYSQACHAEGYKCEAGQEGSPDGKFYGAHAEGMYTKALANGSHAAGRYTVAKQPYQYVIGKYNADNANATFIIGNGTDVADDKRSNLFEVGGNNNTEPYIKLNNVTITETQLSKLLTLLNNLESYGVLVNS